MEGANDYELVQVDSFVKIFAGCSHGWSVRYKDEDEGAVKRAEEAHKDMLDCLLSISTEFGLQFCCFCLCC